MPLCPTCSFRLKVSDQHCENCGAVIVGKSQIARTKPPAPERKFILPPLAPVPDELPPRLLPALSVVLRVVATAVAGLGLMVAGYFWFNSGSAALFLAVLVLAPVIALHRSNTAVLLGLALLSVATGFTSCAANFRWAGG